MHSLQPYDKVISKVFKCCKKTASNEKEDHEKINQSQESIAKNSIEGRNIYENKGFDLKMLNGVD